MCTYIIFGLLFSIFLNSYSVSTGHWIHLRSSMQSSFTDDVSDISNETDLTQKLPESNAANAYENEVFWAIPNKNDTMELEVHTHAENESENINPFQSLDVTEVERNETFVETTHSVEAINVDNKAEENKTTDILYNDISHAEMDEKIVLERNNCHLEIAVQEYQDLQIEIVFGKLQNNNSGKCCITLNGQDNSKLGILISNIYLYQNFTEGEILKVITVNYGSDFVLKEYYSWTKDQPLLLTETHKVYIVLHYQVKIVPPNQQDSHFNLEVFSYHKFENHVHQPTTYSESHFQYNNGGHNLSTSFGPYY